MQFSKSFGVLMSMIGMVLAPHVVFAGETGVMDFIVSAKADLQSLEHGELKITSGTLNGTMTVVKSTGGTFQAGASGSVEGLVYIKKTGSAIDLESPATITDTSGDQLYNVARRGTGTVDTGGGGQGRMEFTGGTGKYAGVSASCPYTVEWLPGGNVVATGLDCKWEKP